MRVLIVEDELRMASVIRRGFISEGLAADVAANGEDALWMAEALAYDAIVLDVMLPGIDGFETCRRLRNNGVWVPVLMLTARDSVDDRVAGLDTGADDYLVKPFAFAELLARLRALTRRGELERPAVLEVGDLRLDPATRGVWRGPTEIPLSAKEFALLETFMRRPDQVLSRLHLLEHAWDFAYENRSNVVDVYVRHLRSKIDQPLGRNSIETLRVAGAFAVAMAVVLAATGWFLYIRLDSHLSLALDRGLRLRAQDLAALIREPGAPLAGANGAPFVEEGEAFAQLLDGGGHVLDATRPLRTKPLLTAAELRAALGGAIMADRRSVPGLDEPSRLLARPVARRGRRLVLVVGATRGDVAEALASLRYELLIAGPIALALASAAGYVLAGFSLRAVESMRRRAAAISAETPGDRLPVPETGDEVERLAKTLNEMLGRLEAAVARERDFVADAGHELRTPLALLRTELELALRHAHSAEELREAVRSSSQEVDRLAQLAEDLLLIARDRKSTRLNSSHVR